MTADEQARHDIGAPPGTLYLYLGDLPRGITTTWPVFPEQRHGRGVFHYRDDACRPSIAEYYAEEVAKTLTRGEDYHLATNCANLINALDLDGDHQRLVVRVCDEDGPEGGRVWTNEQAGRFWGLVRNGDMNTGDALQACGVWT